MTKSCTASEVAAKDLDAVVDTTISGNGVAKKEDSAGRDKEEISSSSAISSEPSLAAKPSSSLPTPPSTPSLTPEQRERIRKNRERALRIQAERKRKAQEQEEAQAASSQGSISTLKKYKPSSEGAFKPGASQLQAAVKGSITPSDCEDWEIEASDWVSKKEAVAKYCLPQGTLAVCEVTIKENPHHKGWAPMKLYRRSELRERAYKRFGGKEGLVAERMRREEKRLEKDLKEAEKVFM